MDALGYRLEMSAHAPADTGLAQTLAVPSAALPLFELPPRLFAAMAAAYVAFIATMAAAFGSGQGMPLLLAIVAFYLAMYLGTPALLARIGIHRRRVYPFRGIATPGGWMEPGAVAAQVLVVPACVAGFGIAISVIVASL